MGNGETGQHPIDYEVHPVGGWIVAAWGLGMCIGPASRGPGEDILPFVVQMLPGVGVMLLGVAMLLPKGRARRSVVGAWVVSIAVWIALMVFAGVA